MTEPFIEAAHVSKIYGSGSTRVEALKDINLALAAGKLTVLMGPSGRGKTTLLSILGCMLAPTAGTVRICGTSISKARPEELAKVRQRHIGFVLHGDCGTHGGGNRHLDLDDEAVDQQDRLLVQHPAHDAPL